MKARKFQSLILDNLTSLLDPHLCPGCQQTLLDQQTFCESCQQRLRPVEHPCRLCGLENQTNDDACAVCLYDPPRWQRMIAPLQYQGLTRELMMQFKFSQSLHFANSLLQTIIHHFPGQPAKPEVLLPVPLHHNRLIERGYNQAFEIGRLMSLIIDIPVDTQTLVRVRDTEAQVGLTAHGREKNILKAFACNNQKNYRHVAVIDDIVTTGSTANEVTKTLHRAGVETVEIWSLARVSL